MRAAVLLTLAVLTSISFAADEANSAVADREKLLALENAWNLAQLHRDAKAVAQILSDNFVYTDTDGSLLTKAQFLADVKDKSYRATSITNDEMQVFAYQNTAIVIGTYRAKGTYKNKPFDHHGRFTDTWIFLDKKWECVASHTTLISPPQ
jgi:ketosteroid isomerase-like protein